MTKGAPLEFLNLCVCSITGMVYSFTIVTPMIFWSITTAFSDTKVGAKCNCTRHCLFSACCAFGSVDTYD